MNRFTNQGAWILGLAAVAVVLGGATIQADTVVGQFSNPVLFGNVANDPTVGSVTFLDNTATAVDSISSSQRRPKHSGFLWQRHYDTERRGYHGVPNRIAFLLQWNERSGHAHLRGNSELLQREQY
jgi:hypothetical protein